MPEENDHERAQKIIRAMESTDRRLRQPRSYAWFNLLLSLIVLAAIILLIFMKRHQFGLLWQHLMHPDSLSVG